MQNITRHAEALRAGDVADYRPLTPGMRVTVQNGFYRGMTGEISFLALSGEYAVLLPAYVRAVNFPAAMLAVAKEPLPVS